MLFGLTNAPSSCQSYVNKILAEKLDYFVNIYLDDILIYTNDPKRVIWKPFDEFWKSSKIWTLCNSKKCHFYQDKVRLLDFIIFKNRIRMEKKRINAVKKWPEQKSVQDIHTGFYQLYKFLLTFYLRL